MLLLPILQSSIQILPPYKVSPHPHPIDNFFFVYNICFSVSHVFHLFYYCYDIHLFTHSFISQIFIELSSVLDTNFLPHCTYKLGRGRIILMCPLEHSAYYLALTKVSVMAVYLGWHFSCALKTWEDIPQEIKHEPCFLHSSGSTLARHWSHLEKL